MAFDLMFGTTGIRDALGFGNKDSKDDFTQIANRFGTLEKPLADFFKQRIGQPGPTFPGGSAAAIAPMSGPEAQSFDFLRKFGEGGTGSTFQAGKQQIEKTLTNQFDPTTSPYYQAVKAEAAANLKDTQRNIADVSAGGGRFYSGARVARQSEAATDVNRDLNTILAALADKERDRALSVIPQALQFGETERKIPLEQAAAFQTLGQLPRALDQAGRDFDVSQFQQSKVDYPLQITQMLTGLLNANQPVLQQNQPGALSQLAGGVGQGAGQIGTALLMKMLLGI